MPSDDFSSCLSTSPCSSTCFSKWCSLNSRTRNCVTVYNPKLSAEEGFTMYPTPISSCPVASGKNAFCGAITHSPWMKYWRHHIAFFSCSFKPSTKELSFRKSFWHAFFCLLSQIQRLSGLTVAWFCVHIKTHVFLYLHNYKVMPTQLTIFHIGALFVRVGFERRAAISQADSVDW